QDAECGHRRGPVVDFWGLCCRCVVRPRRRPPAAGRPRPSASFLGSDMRAAYYGGTGLTGAGQNLGLLEYVGTDLDDLTTYFKNVGQTNTVLITLLSTDGTSISCVYSGGRRCDDTEQTLDMTPSDRHGSGAGKSGGVCRLHRYRNSQRYDDAQPSAHHNWLFVGLDAGGSEHR